MKNGGEKQTKGSLFISHAPFLSQSDHFPRETIITVDIEIWNLYRFS